MNRAETVEILNYLASVSGYKDLDEQAIRAWSLALQGIPRLWAVRHALAWAQTQKWMPKISELLSAIQKEMAGSYWRPPEDRKDERAMWVCFVRGCTVDELTQAEVAAIYG